MALQTSAHSELSRARLHAAPHHKTIAWLKDAQWTRYARVGNCADKYRDLLAILRYGSGEKLIQLLCVTV